MLFISNGGVLGVKCSINCRIRLYFLFELLRYLSIFLIIVLRIANNPHQWWLVSLAIILCGLRIFRYATVLPYVT